MSTIDSNKRIQKVRTEQEIHKALSNFCLGIHTMHVPPQIDDDDIVLYDVFEELLEARKKLAALDEIEEIDFSIEPEILQTFTAEVTRIEEPEPEFYIEDEDAFFAIGFTLSPDIVGKTQAEEQQA